MRKVLKNSNSSGSEFETELRKLECSVNYKTDSFVRRSGGKKVRGISKTVSMKLRIISCNVRGINEGISVELSDL